MDSLLESMGLLCLAIKDNSNNDIGRTKLQKMIYFADRYLNWDVGDYKLHYYGPYSRNISSTLKTIRGKLIEETIPDYGFYKYTLTENGTQFLYEFTKHVCDKKQMKHTMQLFGELSRWNREQLEIAATIDYVQRNNPNQSATDLLKCVRKIKTNFSADFIKKTHKKWNVWRNIHNFN